MGFLSRLTGYDTHVATINILLANYVYFSLTPDQKYQVTIEVVRVQRKVLNKSAGDLRDILLDLDHQPRAVQMQFIAIACRNLGIPGGLHNLYFSPVDNPYRSRSISDERILSTARLIQKNPGYFLNWPGWDLTVCFTRIAQTKGESDTFY